jgi:hypothetical protein
VTALARTRNNCTSKLQTHLLVREGAPHQETRNCGLRLQMGPIRRCNVANIFSVPKHVKHTDRNLVKIHKKPRVVNLERNEDVRDKSTQENKK